MCETQSQQRLRDGERERERDRQRDRETERDRDRKREGRRAEIFAHRIIGLKIGWWGEGRGLSALNTPPPRAGGGADYK
jgi:hypothetical protein